MSDYVFAPPAQPSIAVVGDGARFPVRRIYCVGRNYAAHVREMGRDPDREPPFFFQKPADAVLADAEIAYPPETANLHHEIELVVAIGARGFRIAPEQALDLVYGYAVGIDLTRRDLQLQARDAGRPWSWGKAFDQSAPCAALRRADDIGHPSSGRIWLEVNGAPRQESDISKLIWPVADVIAAISRAMVLQPGDLIYTGTPEGVGPLAPGDEVRGGVDGLGEISLRITQPA